MRDQIKFGTDGWRGVIAEDYTFQNVRRVAKAFAAYLVGEGHADEWVVVGFDRRFASEGFAAAAAEVLAANGLRVYLTEAATPTPVIAFSVVDRQACGAVNITASHNPASDNGLKVRDKNGGAIDPAGLARIESLLPPADSEVARLPLERAIADRRVVRFDPSSAYIEHISKLVDLPRLRNAGLTVMVDSMWGNGGGWFSQLLAGGTTTVKEIHKERNPIFPEMIRPEPIPPNIDAGLQATLQNRADVLLITDGDADRCGIGDEQGRFINQLRVFALLAYYLLEVRGERGPIVKTLSTTTMLNKLGKLYGVPVYETGVGFKYVAPKMLETDALIGGEESGGYAFRGNVPERDGILAGLYFLDLMVRTGKRPSELLETLFAIVGPHYYDRIDSPFSGERKSREELILAAKPETLGGLKVVDLVTTDGFQFRLEDGGWMLIRFSGTEPILRVYCETTHEDKVQAILKDGLRIAGLS